MTKNALITGASSGIGRATALRFARGGFQVGAVARCGDLLDELVDEIKAAGGQGKTIRADLSVPPEIERAVGDMVDTYGGIDVLVNAAGIIADGTIEDTELTDWDAVLAVNLRGPFYLMQCAMPYLVERRGNIVNLSSVTGLRAFPGILAYCVSKAALDQLTRCTALEMADQGVRVNAVNPGLVVTELHRSAGMEERAYAAFLEHSTTTHPLGRVGRPEEVADLIYYLASEQASWMTGVTVPIDGGRAQTCAR